MDSVEVSLSFQGHFPTDAYSERRFMFDRNSGSVQIGRSSTRVTDLTPQINNGWLDSPVISRKHAKITFNPEDKIVYIMDQDSRHGTYMNHERLVANKPRQLAHGDVLRFGIDIQRDDMNYPPPSALVNITKHPLDGSHSAGNSSRGPHRFVVPDDSDSEASSEEDKAPAAIETLNKLRVLAAEKHPRMPPSTLPTGSSAADPFVIDAANDVEHEPAAAWLDVSAEHERRLKAAADVTNTKEAVSGDEIGLDGHHSEIPNASEDPATWDGSAPSLCGLDGQTSVSYPDQDGYDESVYSSYDSSSDGEDVVVDEDDEDEDEDDVDEDDADNNSDDDTDEDEEEDECEDEVEDAHNSGAVSQSRDAPDAWPLNKAEKVELRSCDDESLEFAGYAEEDYIEEDYDGAYGDELEEALLEEAIEKELEGALARQPHPEVSRECLPEPTCCPTEGQANMPTISALLNPEQVGLAEPRAMPGTVVHAKDISQQMPLDDLIEAMTHRAASGVGAQWEGPQQEETALVSVGGLESAQQVDKPKASSEDMGMVQAKPPGQESASQPSLKRKADDISVLCEDEAEPQSDAGSSADPDEMVPKAPTMLRSCVSSRRAPPAPKKMRRTMVEAARLVALGGAAAGVALFTTLVATAPSLT